MEEKKKKKKQVICVFFFLETVTGAGDLVCLSMSKNKHNLFLGKAEPLCEELCTEIDCDKVSFFRLDVMSRAFSFSVVGLSVLACTPYGERLWGLLDPSAEAATQLRLGKDTKLSNHDLLGLVNEHLARRVEDLRQFARKEFQTAGPQTIVLRTSGDSGSIWSVLLQVAIVAAAGYGFLRLSGYPVHDLMFVSRCTLDKMVKPLLDEVQTIWQAAEEGFAEVLAMVRNYREELKGMRGEICGRIEKVDAGVSEVRGEFDQVTAALAKLDEQMDITNQGMQLICAVVAEHVNPPHAPPALRTLGVDTVAHREEIKK